MRRERPRLASSINRGTSVGSTEAWHIIGTPAVDRAGSGPSRFGRCVTSSFPPELAASSLASRRERSTAAGVPARSMVSLTYPRGDGPASVTDIERSSFTCQRLSPRLRSSEAKVQAPAMVVNSSSICASACGAGASLKVASTITPRVPIEPMKSLVRSYPATFFTTLPPVRIIRPSAVTIRSPMVKSRAEPQARFDLRPRRARRRPIGRRRELCRRAASVRCGREGRLAGRAWLPPGR